MNMGNLRMFNEGYTQNLCLSSDNGIEWSGRYRQYGKSKRGIVCIGKYQEVKYMMKLENFVGMMTGHFDNKDQFKKMQAEGKTYCL